MHFPLLFNKLIPGIIVDAASVDAEDEASVDAEVEASVDAEVEATVVVIDAVDTNPTIPRNIRKI